ncbi:hypothetical protein [Chitinophaga filiformis]|uniref:Uncharacterized protein n=1 Tax=Chitinophaga filiformis TaxID=104663 RepID=A0A1G7NHQ3_CHIFI|nr:hypothetical protein [Chitinophaga filiformis]SDF73604.1 hypothetical protein SAMN04488121_102812 [Chitinophaga filiformis]
MRTFNCCRGRAEKTVPCNVPAQSSAPAEEGAPVTNVSAGKPAGFFKRVIRFIKPVLPAFLLALVPKCPFCLAAYVALGTGIGLSVASAKLLHISLLCAAVIPLSLFAAKHIGAYFFPVTITGWRPRQQLFIGIMGILIGSSILLLF